MKKNVELNNYVSLPQQKLFPMRFKTIREFDDLSGLIRQIGFLPLLGNPVAGFSADEIAAEECRYHHYQDGSWSWPLWDWKGPAIQNTPCVYGKFFGGKMRSRFDQYVPRLQMECRIVTEDFVYPKDKHGERYGFGWALLNTPENTVGRAACQCGRTPDESLDRMVRHLRGLLPHTNEKVIRKLIE